MATTEQLVTADDLLKMPDDGYRYELVRGELRKMPPAGFPHGKIAWAIALRLGTHVESDGLGTLLIADTGFVLRSDPDHVRVPDVAFVRQERLEAAADVAGFFPGPPDVAIEVISPSDLYTEVDEKVADYLAAGTLAVIVVNPRRRTVRVHRSLSDTVELTESDTLEVSDIVPGWQMPVKDMFE